MRRLVLPVITIGMAVAGCGGGSGTPKTITVGRQKIAATDLRDVIPGLCATRLAPDQRQARAAFYDRAHAELHQIAIAVEGPDRPLAGRLLGHMQRVEADIAEPTTPTTAIATDVAVLIVTTRAALGRLRVPAPDCTKGRP